MKDALKHPNLLLGLFTFLLLIVSVGFRANGMNSVGDILFGSMLVLGFVHWIWSVIDVMKEYRSNKENQSINIIWVIIVIILPPLGGIIYYAFKRNLNL
jgi:hypothetical protein